MGFDGMFQYGANLSFFDIVSLTLGVHHFSGHIGDELLELVRANVASDSSFDGYNFRPIEYVRDNSYAFGLSIEPFKQIRVYALAYVIKPSAWIRPYAHVPESTMAPTGGDSMQEHSDNQEHVSNTHNAASMTYDASYKGWDIQTGIELSYDFGSFGQVCIAGNINMHQDGQTKHTLGEYSKDNPWEMEYTAGFAFSVNKSGGGRLGIEAVYRDARMPLINMFYNRGRYFSIGVTIVD